jgi:amidase
LSLTSLPAADLARRLRAGDLSAAEVLDAFLDRIATANPVLNAIVSLRDRGALMAEAETLDRGPRRGALWGLPLAVKDLVATEGIVTTWGSPLHAGHVPAADDGLAGRLRAAGAILIGKTNTPEFGLGSHTFNEVFGATSNPYDPERTPGGSSGGAAVAVAARMLPVADGSDMMGSLRNPAAFCNVYGFRPTVGLVPPDPVGDVFGPGLSTDGPMARSPRDLALLLSVLAARDPRLPVSLDPPVLSAIDPQAAGRRIGWLGDWGGALPVEPGILSLCEAALGSFAGLGARVEPVRPPFPVERLWSAWTTLRSAAVAAKYRTLHADTDRRARLKPEAVWEIERGLALSAMDVHAASVARSEWFAALATLLERFDVLALPAGQVWPFPVGWRWPQEVAGRAMDTYHRWMEVMVPVSLAGVPCLAAPAGFGAAGLPMGLQLFARRGADRALLQLGQAYHEATDWPSRRPPPDRPGPAGPVIQTAGAGGRPQTPRAR